MKLKDKVAVVTGGASGIGKALAERFIKEQAKKVIIVDLDEVETQKIAQAMGAVGMRADVSVESDIINIVKKTEQQFGTIDLFCSNAGIGIHGGFEVSDEGWQKIWEINLMAHVYAARAVIPGMVKRGRGYIVNTASAAGLLSQIGSAPYAVTKHAAVGFAEYLAITHGKQGIKVSLICPQAVETKMTAHLKNGGVAGVDGMISPEKVADCAIEAIEKERFLILPHPEVLTYMQRKTSDYDRWLGGMQRLQERFDNQSGR